MRHVICRAGDEEATRFVLRGGCRRATPEGSRADVREESERASAARASEQDTGGDVLRVPPATPRNNAGPRGATRGPDRSKEQYLQ